MPMPCVGPCVNQRLTCAFCAGPGVASVMSPSFSRPSANTVRQACVVIAAVGAPSFAAAMPASCALQHEFVDVALLRRELAVHRIRARDVAGQALEIRGRVHEQQIAVLHLPRRRAVVQRRRVRSAADDGGIAPGHRAVLHVPVLDRGFDFVLPSARPRGLHAFDVRFGGNLDAAAQHLLFVRRLHLPQRREDRRGAERRDARELRLHLDGPRRARSRRGRRRRLSRRGAAAARRRPTRSKMPSRALPAFTASKNVPNSAAASSAVMLIARAAEQPVDERLKRRERIHGRDAAAGRHFRRRQRVAVPVLASRIGLAREQDLLLRLRAGNRARGSSPPASCRRGTACCSPAGTRSRRRSNTRCVGALHATRIDSGPSASIVFARRAARSARNSAAPPYGGIWPERELDPSVRPATAATHINRFMVVSPAPSPV